jgi:hypothetical protein
MPLTCEDINLFGIQDNFAVGLSGEACASYRLFPEKDLMMCSYDDQIASINAFSRFLSSFPSGYGLLFESEVVDDSSVSSLAHVKNGCDPFIEELMKGKAAELSGQCRSVETYLHVWSSGIEPLRLPFLPSFFPNTKRRRAAGSSLVANIAQLSSLSPNLEASLSSCGIRSKLLERDEVLGRVHRILSPRGSLAGVPVINNSVSLRSQLCAANAEELKEGFFLDGYYHGVVSFYQFADDLDLGAPQLWLEQLPVGSRYVVGVMVPDQEHFLSRLKTRHKQAGMMLNEAKSKDFESGARMDELDRVISLCRNEGERIYLVWGAVILRAKDLETLDDWKNQSLEFIKRQFNGATGIVEDTLHRRMFMASVPMGAHLSPRRQMMMGATVGALAPISQSWNGSGGGGLVMRGSSGEIARLDPFASGSPKMGIVCGGTGAGKSVTSNLMIIPTLADPENRILVIDVGGSYKRLAEVLGSGRPDGAAAYFDVKVSDEFALSPILPRSAIVKGDGSPDPEMIAAQTSLLAEMADVKSGPTRVLLEKAIARAFEENEEPLLADIYRIIRSSSWDTVLKKAVEPLTAALMPYVEGVYSNLLSRKSKIRPFQKQLTVFDLYGLREHKELQRVLVAVIAFNLQREMADRTRRKLLIIDEGWELFQSEKSAELVSMLYRQARKHNASIMSLSQSPADFLKSGVSTAVMDNIQWVIAMRIGSEKDRMKAFGFTDQAIDRGAHLRLVPKQFSEALVRYENKSQKIVRISPSSMEYWISTSDAEDRKRENGVCSSELAPTERVRIMAEKEPMKLWTE